MGNVLVNDKKNSTKMIGKIIGVITHSLTMFSTFIAPMQTYLYVTAFNVIMDFIIGVYKAIVYDKKKWSRAKFIETVKSLIFFFFALLMGYIMEIFLVPSIPLLLTIAISINFFFFIRSLKNLSILSGVDIWTNVIKLFKKSE